MAQLLGVKEQQEALKRVVALLKELSETNKFLNEDNPEKVYKISFEGLTPFGQDEAQDTEGEDNKKKKAKAPMFAAFAYAEDKELVNQLVLNHKEHVVTEILELAENYRIELDAEDQEVLGLMEKADNE